MANHIGRFIGLLVVIAVAAATSIEWTFIIGAVAALAFNLIYMAVKKD